MSTLHHFLSRGFYFRWTCDICGEGRTYGAVRNKTDRPDRTTAHLVCGWCKRMTPHSYKGIE